MDESYSFPTHTARSRQHPLRLVIVAAIAAFLLGAVLTFYLARETGWLFGPEVTPTADAGGDAFADLAQEGESGGDDADPGLSATQQAQTATIAARRVAKVAEQQGGLDQRVAAMEQRLSRLDLQAQAAAGNAARAEGLLIAFAARRAIERGAPLGYLSDQLRLRFADALPNAVKAVNALSDDPITLDQLLARLDGLAPSLGDTPSDEGLLPRIGREISQLFVIRTEDTPSPRSESRLRRARQFLESGRVEAAIAEIRNMPNAREAAAWIEDAQRYARAQRGLELLETTAILEPRQLRDGTGNRVEQPSPAA